ncbi:MAG: aminoacyl-histidine dipeptidase [Flavobacteriales bacterium]|nr:aminoacyl-histidine dipeptidase [Flavobacteriales bacterium]
MSNQIAQLIPNALWSHFAQLNSVPRPSKKEERVRAWVISLGHKLGLETQTDEVGNVLIRKPATIGMENRVGVVLQSHLDMVCQKNNETVFDFDTQGIRMYIDGDWVRAEGTTLGADNGIGVAAILGVLASDDIPHPPLEALFTIDEETGMTGALGLKGGFLQGEILLNLDTEDDDELSIGCAGGVDVTSSGSFGTEQIEKGISHGKLTIKGGSGGHSGMDITKGIANVNKVMNRVLLVTLESVDFRISTIQGGGLRNAIPRESACNFVIDPNDFEFFKESVLNEMTRVQGEHRTTDPDLTWELTENEDQVTEVMSEEEQELLLLAIQACPVGIHRMSPEIEGLVQTSNNLAQVEVGNGLVTLRCLCRSSVDSEKDDHARSIASAFALAGLETAYGGAYPGWTPNPSSDVVSLFKDLYEEQFGESPRVLACHAGLECGILGTNYPDMDMVSFGPNIRGAHSPDECVQISSVQKFWGFFLEGLSRIPVKA